MVKLGVFVKKPTLLIHIYVIILNPYHEDNEFILVKQLYLRIPLYNVSKYP